MKTYTTSQIAKIVGVHPNTVRMYEKWGLISIPDRKANGYRIYTDIHIAQFEMAKKAFQIELLQSGMRKQMIDALKFCAQCKFDEASACVVRYLEQTEREIEHTKEAARLTASFFQHTQYSGKTYKRADAAKALHVTIDTIRNWEMNGLITVKRKENGYRIYDTNDMNRLKIIRTLRCANYSLSSILRMFQALENQESVETSDVLNILNTPRADEEIILACDKLMDSLYHARKNAKEVLTILNEIKKYF